MTYAVIAADPAWHEPGGCNRGSDDQYATGSKSELLEAMVRAPCWKPAENCHLYLWTTMTSLLDGLWMLDALGFRYVTHGIWVKAKGDDGEKLDIGLGQYFRGAHEVFLLGTRGRGFAVRSEAKDIPSVLVAPVPRENGRKVHSRKPDEFYAMVERRTVGARLEMFSRRARPGWDGWGNELVPAEVAPIDSPAGEDAAPWE